MAQFPRVETDPIAIGELADYATIVALNAAISGVQSDLGDYATTVALNSAISGVQSDLTDAVAGIETQLAPLATITQLNAAVSAHEADTTNIHGIVDTTKLFLTDGTRSMTGAANGPSFAATAPASGTTAVSTSVVGDTVSRLIVAASGAMTWGPGGATAIDTNLYRFGVGILATDKRFVIGPGLTSAGIALSLRASGDTNDRFQSTASGVLTWGPGNAAGDTNLYRAGVGQLKSDNVLILSSDLVGSGQVKAKEGLAAQTRLGAYGPGSESGVQFGVLGDTNLYRATADSLKTDDLLTAANFFTGGSYTNGGAAANARTLGTQATGDAAYAFEINNRGLMIWGSGAAAADTNLYRGGSDLLRTDDGFIAARLGINAGITANVMAAFFAQGAGYTPIIARMAATPTANAQEWQSSGAAVLAAVTSLGQFYSAAGMSLGTSTYRQVFTITPANQIESTTAAGSALSIVRNSNDVNPPNLYFGKSRAAANGGVTSVISGDTVGYITFAAANGTNMTSIAARQRIEINNTVTPTSTPGAFIWETTPDGATTSVDRLKLDRNGKLAMLTAGAGLQLVSPDGLTTKLLSIDNSGALVVA